MGHVSLLSLLLVAVGFPAIAAPVYDNLVDIQSVDPTIRVELRYASADNITGHALYPPSTPALVRPGRGTAGGRFHCVPIRPSGTPSSARQERTPANPH